MNIDIASMKQRKDCDRKCMYVYVRAYKCVYSPSMFRV